MPNNEEEYKYAEDAAQPEDNRRNAGMAYTSPIDRFGSQISVLTNPNDALYRFELYLRCLKEDEQGNFVKIGGKNWKPLMNDTGINDILMSMHSILNNMTPLSNIEEWEVGIIIEHLGWDLVDLLAFNRNKFELDEINRRAVFGSALRFCYIFLKRPFEEGDKKFFKGITQEIKSVQEIHQGRKSSVLNPLSWGKR